MRDDDGCGVETKASLPSNFATVVHALLFNGVSDEDARQRTSRTNEQNTCNPAGRVREPDRIQMRVGGYPIGHMSSVRENERKKNIKIVVSLN